LGRDARAGAHQKASHAPAAVAGGERRRGATGHTRKTRQVSRVMTLRDGAESGRRSRTGISATSCAGSPPHVAMPYIKRIYRTLMSRGMRSCYVYCVDVETPAALAARLLSMTLVASVMLSSPPGMPGRLLTSQAQGEAVYDKRSQRRQEVGPEGRCDRQECTHDQEERSEGRRA
jgi:hypothetical protein